MKKLLFTALILVFLLSACGAGSQLEITDPGQTIEASAGDEFQIVIESNPTTGYHWEIVGELDVDVVRHVSTDYQSTSSADQVGGGGVDIWTFTAVGPGSATIVLGSYPPSNDPVEPENTVTFNVTVK
jgi:inhibitor of cysteine peptidase